MSQPAFLASEYAPVAPDAAAFHIIPAPLEQSVSYGGGTARGPQAILEASQQLEAWDGQSAPGETGLYTAPAIPCDGPVETVLERIEAAVREAVKEAQGEKTLVEYQLIPIDETLPEDPEIQTLADSWKAQVDASYLSAYGLTYDQVLTTSGFNLDTPPAGIQQGNGLGELAADSYLWAVSNLEAEAPEAETVAVTAAGVLRAPLYSGDVTVSQAFDVLSLGVGADGTSGYPLVGVYLTGKELRAVLEVDASVTPIMPEAQLYLSGIAYSFNTHRMFFNRVTQAAMQAPAFAGGSAGPVRIEDDRLYRVVTGMYSAQMLGTVKEKSFGLLNIQPKDENGQPVTDFTQYILRDKNGNEIKEWYALASYLASFGEDGLPDSYAFSDGRKDVFP